MQTFGFKSYLANLNRVRFIELIDNCQAELRSNSFQASLVVNPVTGLAYNAPSIIGTGREHVAAA
jgi:hypothetical protein